MNRCERTAVKLRILRQNDKMLEAKDKRAIRKDQLSFVGMRGRGIRKAARTYGVSGLPVRLLKQNNAEKHPTNRTYGARKIMRTR